MSTKIYRLACISRPSDIPGGMRTSDAFGTITSPPRAGLPLTHIGAPLTEGADIRVIQTSLVKDVMELDSGWTFWTESGSVYELTEASVSGSFDAALLERIQKFSPLLVR